MYVTEDTTRADPDTLRQLYSTAIRAGASRVCISDTVGHATPAGAAAVTRFIAEVVAECGGGVGIDWHGHRDRDLAVMNSIAGDRRGRDPAARLRDRHRRARRQHADGRAAREPGADGLSWSATSRRWSSIASAVAAATGVPIPPNYPVVGRDAFRTATGVHAAAVIKAFRKQDRELVDAVYSGVPASLVGREQEIEVGPMSGKSNVVFWLEKRGVPVSDALVERIFARAKRSASVLRDDEIRQLIERS